MFPSRGIGFGGMLVGSGRCGEATSAMVLDAVSLREMRMSYESARVVLFEGQLLYWVK